MLSLFGLYLCMVISGLCIASFLKLPNRALQSSIAFAAGCGQLILSIQVLSLFHALRGPELLMINAAFTIGFGIMAKTWKRSNSPPDTDRISGENWRERLATFGRLNVLFTGLIIGAFLFGVATAPFAFPATDPYHFNMGLFWKQNESINAFPVHDPRVVSVVFASEALAFPGIVYFNSPHGFILFSVLAAILSCWLVYELARSVGANNRVALASCLVFAASTSCVSSIWSAKSDFLLSTLWLLGSVHFLFQGHSRPNRTRMFLGCSAFLFAMACGAKNTILLHSFAFLIALFLIYGGKVFRPRPVAHMIAMGFAGAVVSGVLWSYAQNQIWFGDWRGHPYLKETLARNFDLPAIWTRLCRGFVNVAYDCSWLPNRVQPEFAQLTEGTIRLLGGKPILSEDHEFYSLPTESIRPGNGMGVVGPFVLLPSLAMASWFIIRRRPWVSCNADELVRFRALVIFAIVSFVTFYIVLRTQKIGVTRLMVSCIAIAMPITAVALRTRLGYPIGMLAGAFSLLLNVAHGTSFAAHRTNSRHFTWITSLKRTAAEEAELQWGTKTTDTITLREPYTTREIYQLISPYIEHAGIVGLIGGFNAEGYSCFGRRMSNRVVILKDSRSDVVTAPPREVNFVVVEGIDFRTIDPAILLGFKRVMQVGRKGVPFFAAFERAAAQ